jgi:hypothetical protein
MTLRERPARAHYNLFASVCVHERDARARNSLNNPITITYISDL